LAAAVLLASGIPARTPETVAGLLGAAFLTTGAALVATGGVRRTS
jgi:hypothetical protein